MLSLPKLLRADRAESSMMAVIGTFVSALLLIAIAGVVFVLVTGGARIQAENYAQTELRIANRQFINDIEKASSIRVIDDTRFVIERHDLLSADDLDGDGKLDDPVCTRVQYSITDADETAIKKLGVSAAKSVIRLQDKSVDTTCSVSAGISTKVLVSAVTADSFFRYTNIAGVQLTFSNGVIIALDSTTYTPPIDAGGVVIGLDPSDEAQMEAFRSEMVQNYLDTHVGATVEQAEQAVRWYTDEEVTREIPKVVEANFDAIFPVTELNKAHFIATTDDALTELEGDGSDVIMPPGEQEKWVPNPVNGISIQRSTNPTTGSVVGGAREGLTLSWTARPAVECPAGVDVIYNWSLRDSANRSTSGQTTNITVEVDSDDGAARVWNGGHYTATVSARCNDTDGSSRPSSGTGVLSLPDVLGVTVSASPSDERAQTVSWARASSDPSTTYAVQLDRASSSASYTKSTPIDVAVWMRASPSFTAIGTTGSLSLANATPSTVPGFPETYRVRASTGDTPNTSGAWSPGNYIYASPTPSSGITSLNDGSMSWTAITCPAGNSREYLASIDASHTPDATYQGANTSMVFATIYEGNRVVGTVQARCTTPYTLDPTDGQPPVGWSTPSTATYDRPVSPPSMSWSGGNANVAAGTYVARTAYASCAVGTTPIFTTASSFSATRSTVTGVTWTASAYCQGAFVPSASSTTSRTVNWRAATTPSGGGVGNIYEWSTRDSGGPIVVNLTWDAIPDADYATSYEGQTRANLLNGVSTSWASNTSLTCTSTGVQTIQGRARASNAAGSSAWVTSGVMSYAIPGHRTIIC